MSTIVLADPSKNLWGEGFGAIRVVQQLIQVSRVSANISWFHLICTDMPSFFNFELFRHIVFSCVIVNQWIGAGNTWWFWLVHYSRDLGDIREGCWCVVQIDLNSRRVIIRSDFTVEMYDPFVVPIFSLITWSCHNWIVDLGAPRLILHLQL
jgi:hypothetical protein